MPFRICKVMEIESAHMLSKHPEKCRFPHGHSRKIELVLESDTLDQNDMVCDFKVIKSTIHEFIQSFDHAMCINTEDPHYQEFKSIFGDKIIGLKGSDPTSEVMAKMIFHAVKHRLAKYLDNPDTDYPLGQGVRIVRIRLWETSTAWAEYFEAV